MVTTAEIIDRLKTATTDLYWSSEADYPFEIVTWDNGIEMTPTALFDRSTEDLDLDAIVSSSLTDLFAPLLTVEDWYEEAELVNVDRYRQLLKTIETDLSDIKVFRIGEVEVTIYIVGKTADGDPIGLRTRSVET
jgi:Nuclease A inhibitor-like protein